MLRGISELRSAEVAELADAQDLGSCGRKAVGVQLPPSAPLILFLLRFPDVRLRRQFAPQDGSDYWR